MKDEGRSEFNTKQIPKLQKEEGNFAVHLCRDYGSNPNGRYTTCDENADDGTDGEDFTAKLRKEDGNFAVHLCRDYGSNPNGKYTTCDDEPAPDDAGTDNTGNDDAHEPGAHDE